MKPMKYKTVEIRNYASSARFSDNISLNGHQTCELNVVELLMYITEMTNYPFT